MRKQGSSELLSALAGSLVGSLKRWVGLGPSLQDRVREIDEEIEHHIVSRADALERDGLTRSEARAEAERQFGDLSGIRASLLAEQGGAQVAGAIASRLLVGTAAAAVVALCGVVAFQFAQLRDTESRLLTLSEEVVGLRAEMRAGETATRIPFAQRINFVTLDGAVAKPLVWVFEPRDDVTLRDLIRQAGGLAEGASGRISVCRMRGEEIVDTIVVSADEWADPEGIDPTIDGSFYIHAEAVPTGIGGDGGAGDRADGVDVSAYRAMLASLPLPRLPR